MSQARRVSIPSTGISKSIPSRTPRVPHQNQSKRFPVQASQAVLEYEIVITREMRLQPDVGCPREKSER